MTSWKRTQQIILNSHRISHFTEMLVMPDIFAIIRAQRFTNPRHLERGFISKSKRRQHQTQKGTRGLTVPDLSSQSRSPAPPLTCAAHGAPPPSLKSPHSDPVWTDYRKGSPEDEWKNHGLQNELSRQNEGKAPFQCGLYLQASVASTEKISKSNDSFSVSRAGAGEIFGHAL